MDTLLIKIFATALAFSQVATVPDRVKTEFDPIQDRQQVVSLLRGGCAQMRKAFDIEDLNVDDLIATAMDDPDAVAGGHAAFRGINIKDLHVDAAEGCVTAGHGVRIVHRCGDQIVDVEVLDVEGLAHLCAASAQEAHNLLTILNGVELGLDPIRHSRDLTEG